MTRDCSGDGATKGMVETPSLFHGRFCQTNFRLTLPSRRLLGADFDQGGLVAVRILGLAGFSKDWPRPLILVFK